MRILVTGGTGFVGSHSIACLVAAGHDVRILARSPAKVPGTLAALAADADAVEVVQGDLLDRTAVDRALTGMDAVLHAASIYSFDIRRAAEMHQVNVGGMRQLIELAAERGLDPIVHVSSVAALWRQNVPVQRLHEDAPPGDVPFPYSQSKAGQERIARHLQEQGAPVVTTYPGQVFGPYDPYDGEGTQLVRSIVRGDLTMCPRGDLAVADVRDVASLHARLFEPARGPRRFLIARRIPLLDLVRMTLKLAGRSLPVSSVPDGMIRLASRTAGWLQRRIEIRLSFSEEASWIAIQHLEIDMSRTEQLGIACRPVEETITDQLAWQQSAGRL